MLIAFSTLAVLLIAAGLYYRRQAVIHMPLMVAAFTVDLGLLLYIETTRHAIQAVQTEIQATSHHPLLLFHVSVSAIMLGLYVVQIVSGYKLFKGGSVSRAFHRYAGWSFVGFRLLNYVTSFFVEGTPAG